VDRTAPRLDRLPRDDASEPESDSESELLDELDSLEAPLDALLLEPEEAAASACSSANMALATALSRDPGAAPSLFSTRARRAFMVRVSMSASARHSRMAVFRAVSEPVMPLALNSVGGAAQEAIERRRSGSIW
jgi:hypothetical protein